MSVDRRSLPIPDPPPGIRFPHLTRRELAVLVPIVLLIIAMGVYPPFFTRRSQPALDNYVHNQIPGARRQVAVEQPNE